MCFNVKVKNLAFDTSKLSQSYHKCMVFYEELENRSDIGPVRSPCGSRAKSGRGLHGANYPEAPGI